MTDEGVSFRMQLGGQVLPAVDTHPPQPPHPTGRQQQCCLGDTYWMPGQRTDGLVPSDTDLLGPAGLDKDPAVVEAV